MNYSKDETLFDIPPSLTTFHTFKDSLPYPRSLAQVLYLSRAGKFPPYRRLIGNQTPALWEKNALIAFWETQFSAWPEKVEALRVALGKAKAKSKKKPTEQARTPSKAKTTTTKKKIHNADSI